MKREEKIKALENNYKYGNITSNKALMSWLGDEIGEADTVMYGFNDEVVSYTIGGGQIGCNNSSTCGEDKWEDCDDEFIDYLYSL